MRQLGLNAAGRIAALLRREWHSLLLTSGVCLLVPLFALSVLALPPQAVEGLTGPLLGRSSVGARLP